MCPSGLRTIERKIDELNIVLGKKFSVFVFAYWCYRFTSLNIQRPAPVNKQGAVKTLLMYAQWVQLFLVTLLKGKVEGFRA